MKKSRFIWILRDEKQRISTDRQFRFREGRKEITVPRIVSDEAFYKDNALLHGDFMVLKHHLNSYIAIIGQIVNFNFVATTKKARKFPYSFCVVNINRNVEITMSPCYSVQISGDLVALNNVTCSIKSYICSLKSKTLNLSNMSIKDEDVTKLKSFLE
jgi:hypothetical protein